MSQPLVYLSVLRRGTWFSSLPTDAADRLIAHSRVLHLGAREPLFARSDRFCGIYCVLDGVIRLSAVNAEGRESIMGFAEPSQWFGEISLFDRLPRSIAATAEDSATVLHLSELDIDRLLQLNPLMALHFGHLLAQKMRTALLAVEAMALLPRNGRMARYLMMIATQHWSVTPECRRTTVPFQQEQIAMLMLVTRQTVGLALKDLESEGIIRRQYGHVEILDWDRLAQVAELGPDEQAVSLPSGQIAKILPFRPNGN